jgi:hypothetical protein
MDGDRSRRAKNAKDQPGREKCTKNEAQKEAKSKSSKGSRMTMSGAS